MRLVLGPTHFAVLLRYLFSLLMVWFFQVLFKKLPWPGDFLPIIHDLILV